jgi:hypothetical protein
LSDLSPFAGQGGSARKGFAYAASEKHTNIKLVEDDEDDIDEFEPGEFVRNPKKLLQSEILDLDRELRDKY